MVYTDRDSSWYRPEHIKEQWVGVPLPIRHTLEEPAVFIGRSLVDSLDVTLYEDGVDVFAFDAAKALRLFERDEAADFWAEAVPQHTELLFERNYGSVHTTTELSPTLPWVEVFDQLD